MEYYTRSLKRKANSRRNHLQSALKMAKKTLESWGEVDPKNRFFFVKDSSPEISEVLEVLEVLVESGCLIPETSDARDDLECTVTRPGLTNWDKCK